jgi:hypothetical protein
MHWGTEPRHGGSASVFTVGFTGTSVRGIATAWYGAVSA